MTDVIIFKEMSKDSAKDLNFASYDQKYSSCTIKKYNDNGKTFRNEIKIIFHPN